MTLNDTNICRSGFFSGIVLVRVKELSSQSEGLEFGYLIFQQFKETGIKYLLGVILCPALRL